MNQRDDIAQPPAIEAFKKAHPNLKEVVLTGDTKEAVTEYMVKDLFPKLLKGAGPEMVDTVAFEWAPPTSAPWSPGSRMPTRTA